MCQKRPNLGRGGRFRSKTPAPPAHPPYEWVKILFAETVFRTTGRQIPATSIQTKWVEKGNVSAFYRLVVRTRQAVDQDQVTIPTHVVEPGHHSSTGVPRS